MMPRRGLRFSDLERRTWTLLLIFVLLGYLLIAVRDNFALSVGHGPDGPLHLQYVRFVADTHRLPAATLPPEDNVASQESLQPPLYYIVTAALTGWTTQPAVVRPAAQWLKWVFSRRASPQASSNVGALYASPVDLWPQSTVVAGYAARGLSILAGLLALVCVFGLLRVLTGSPWLAVAGTCWLGWNFNYPYVHALISNDAFVVLVVAAVLWYLARLYLPVGYPAVVPEQRGDKELSGVPIPLGEALPLAVEGGGEGVLPGPARFGNGRGIAPHPPTLFPNLGRWEVTRRVSPGASGHSPYVTDRSLVWLGVLLGLLALTKLNALAVLPVVMLAVAWRTPGRRLRALVIVGCTTAAVAGWWYARNLWLYGDPAGLRIFTTIEAAKGAVYPRALGWSDLRSILISTYYALFYYYQPWLPLVALNLAAFAGAVGALVHREWRAPVLILGAIVLLTIPSYLAWAGRFIYGTSPRLLLAAWPALAGLWAIGLAAWLPRRLHPLVPLVVLPVMALHLAGVMDARRSTGGRTTSYTFIPLLSAYDRPEMDRGRAVEFGPHLALVGSRLIRDGRQAIVALEWQLRAGTRDLQTSFYVHVVDDAGKVAQVDTFYQTDPLPLPAWRRGQTVLCIYRLRLPRSATGPLEVYAGVYSRETMQAMPATEAGVDVPGGNLLVGVLPGGP